MYEPDFKQQILSKLRLYLDEPEENDIQFDYPLYSKQIVNILLDKKTETPFTLGIHGEWGAGKTTLIKKIKKDLELHKNKNFEIIEFDAWKYERTDIVSALLQKIHSEFKTSKKIKEFATAVGLFVADQALQHYTGISLKNPINQFRNFISKIETVSASLEKIVKDKLGDGRLIIIIDDLDRCHVENVLDMLEAIKMLLYAKQVIFVIAVDMTKIERAWQLRYEKETGLVEGRDHIDKIFQLKLSLPPKTDEEIKSYLEKLAKSFAYTDLEYFVKSCPGNNPRKVKRMINLLYFILLNFEIPGNTQKIKNENFDVFFEILITWISITMNHPDIAKKIIHHKSSLIVASSICSSIKILDSFNAMKRFIVERDSFDASIVHKYQLSRCPPVVMDILEIIITRDQLAFMTLKRFADQRRLDFNHSLYDSDIWTQDNDYSETYRKLDYVIRNAGLVGI